MGRLNNPLETLNDKILNYRINRNEIMVKQVLCSRTKQSYGTFSWKGE